ncbi:MAG: hypothetical protein VYB20_02715 [Pseudomonadota bacterium]|nr:hypothetical protein [Pseudomonadota bacterium]
MVQTRISSREEVPQTLTGYMPSGELRDSASLRAAELTGGTDRIEAATPEL